MRKKRIMVIGPRGSGKTSLVNKLNGYEGRLRKTQDVIYGPNTIDVPASYIESTWLYKHTIALAQDAWCILLLVDQSQTDEIYSHGFAKAFRCPTVGIISKCDLNIENEEKCRRRLEQIGAQKPYFRTSIYDQESIKKLKDYLSELKER